MKTIFTILAFQICLCVYGQDSASYKSSNPTTLPVVENRVGQTKEDINRLQHDLEQLTAKVDEKDNRIKDDIIDRMNLYVYFITVILAVIGIVINLLGKNAIRKKVEELVNNTVQKQADKRISEVLNSNITGDLIEALVKQKSEEEISGLIKRLEEKGDSAITQFKSRSNEVIALIATPTTKSKKSKALSDSEITQEHISKQITEFFNLAYKSQDPAIQIELYKNVLKLDPKNASALNNLGVAYNNLNEADKALEVLNKAIEINNKFYQAFANRGNSFNLKDKLDKALEDVDTAIMLKPSFEYSYALKGNILTKLGRFEEAEKALNTAVEMNPQSAEAYLNRGFFYEEQGKYDESLKSYDKAEVLGFSNKAHLYNNIAVLFRRLKKYDKAVEFLEKAREFNPSFPNIDGTLALIYADKGDEENFYYYLTIALEKGCLVWNYLSDPGFEAYRNSQRLQMLIEPYRKRYFQKQS